MTDTALVARIQDQLERLLQQLVDIEAEKGNLDESEYEEMKADTKTQLDELHRSLDKIADGNISTVDAVSAAKMAIRAAISEAFRTPEVVAYFSKKQPAQLRLKLSTVENAHRMQKLNEDSYRLQKREILVALQILKEPLNDEEVDFLRSCDELNRFDLFSSTNK